jgi:hypothetical protein
MVQQGLDASLTLFWHAVAILRARSNCKGLLYIMCSEHCNQEGHEFCSLEHGIPMSGFGLNLKPEWLFFFLWVVSWCSHHQDHVVLNGRMIVELKTNLEGGDHGLIEYYPSICLEGLRKPLENLIQDIQHSSQNLNWVPPTCECGILPLCHPAQYASAFALPNITL